MTMISKRTSFAELLVAGSLGVAALWSGVARAQDRPGPTWAEFQKLQAEVREQRQLMIQIMQSDQQRYDTLLRLLQQGGGAPAAEATVPGSTGTAAARSRVGSPVVDAAKAPAARADIEGSVRLPGGHAGSVYVYVDGLRGPPAKGRTLEIKQEDKQFNPSHAVVQVGTAIMFPNKDSIFHNVFSNSPKNAFDLGTFRAGPPPRPVVMAEPGVVDLQCNMHEDMRASVLVVPNKMFVRVRPDGTFKLEGIPTGHRRLVAWGPNLKPARQAIELGPTGGRAEFALEPAEHKTPLNKLGQPYGSYDK
jgi:plastocyanin